MLTFRYGYDIITESATKGNSSMAEQRSPKPSMGVRIPHRPPLNWKRSSQGDRFCLGPAHGIRTRKGAELRKREAFSSAAREGRRPEAKAGGVSRTRHPSSPTTDLIGSQQWEPFFFGPSAWDSNPPAHLSQRPWPNNGKNEYCYFACNI